MVKIKRKRLKTQWLIVFTMLFTLSTQIVIKEISNRIITLNRMAEQCDIKYGYTCSTYQLRKELTRED